MSKPKRFPRSLNGALINDNRKTHQIIWSFSSSGQTHFELKPDRTNTNNTIPDDLKIIVRYDKGERVSV